MSEDLRCRRPTSVTSWQSQRSKTMQWLINKHCHSMSEWLVVCVEWCQVSAAPCYRHSGKARRGDGNDVSPNPAKLYATGKELAKLAHLISTMCPPAELPSSVRARTVREKNRYASRVCRLKKKAQHEANKIKLHGLEQEHRTSLPLHDS